MFGNNITNMIIKIFLHILFTYVPSSTALATSVASARVGLGVSVIESTTRDTIIGFPAILHLKIAAFWNKNICMIQILKCYSVRDLCSHDIRALKIRQRSSQQFLNLKLFQSILSCLSSKSYFNPMWIINLNNMHSEVELNLFRWMINSKATSWKDNSIRFF